MRGRQTNRKIDRPKANQTSSQAGRQTDRQRKQLYIFRFVIFLCIYVLHLNIATILSLDMKAIINHLINVTIIILSFIIVNQHNSNMFHYKHTSTCSSPVLYNNNTTTMAFFYLYYRSCIVRAVLYFLNSFLFIKCALYLRSFYTLRLHGNSFTCVFIHAVILKGNWIL